MHTLVDNYNRNIDYMRISVTDRCNLSCIYCMPVYGMQQKSQSEILTFEEIVAIVRIAASLGIDKVKITGGEPLMRRDLPRLITMLFSISGLQDVSLTTNAVLLERYAEALKTAGLKKINISIDTLNSQKFKHITRSGNFEDVLRSIDAAISENFFIKLNVVIMRGINDDEILSFVEFARERKIIVRFIELMPIGNNNISSQDLYMSCEEIKERLRLLGNLEAIISEELGNGPAQYYKIVNLSSVVGFISPISRNFCFNCNRLRLTVDGLLMPCLNTKAGIDLKKPLRYNKEKEVLNLLKKAAFLKPERHNLNFLPCSENLMYQIGG